MTASIPQLDAAQDAGVAHALDAIMRFGGAMPVGVMGTGKTRVALRILEEANVKQALVIAPRTVVRDEVWRREMEKLAGPEWDTIALWDGTVSQRAKRLHEARRYSRRLLATMNYEAIIREPLRAELLHEWDAVICDESHRIKSAGGKQSMTMKQLAPQWKPREARWTPPLSPLRMGLTGTPMPHSPMDVYAQARFVAPVVFGTSFARFKARYGIWGGFQDRKLIGMRNEDDFRERLDRFMHRIEADVLGLPAARHITRDVLLEPKARKIYEQAANGLIEKLEEHELGDPALARNVLVELLWMQEITGGWWRDPESEVIHDVSSAKQEALQEILDDLPADEPVVVFCKFTRDLRKVAEVSGSGYRELSGQRDDLAAWRAGDGRVLGVQIQAGGVGVDLTRAAYCVYYSKGVSNGDYQQSLARVHRPGQDRPVLYYHLHAVKTVDSWVAKILAERTEVVSAILDSPVQKVAAFLRGENELELVGAVT